MERILENGITFAYKANPSPANIGDALASPRTYFNFEMHDNKNVIVVGGGAIPDARKIFLDDGYDIRIIWGVGTSMSVKPGRRQRRREKLSSFYRFMRSLVGGKGNTSVIASSRDPGAYEKFLVPCASCFHSITSMKRGTGIAVVLNANPKVSGNFEELSKVIKSEFEGIEIVSNAMSEAQLVDLFRRTDRIVTNSYHFTYWSLLSGGKVSAISHSTKIPSLLRLFEFPDGCAVPYEPGNSENLRTEIAASIDGHRWKSLPDPEATREKFRTLNTDFAKVAMTAFPGLYIREKSIKNEA